MPVRLHWRDGEAERRREQMSNPWLDGLLRGQTEPRLEIGAIREYLADVRRATQFIDNMARPLCRLLATLSFSPTIGLVENGYSSYTDSPARRPSCGHAVSGVLEREHGLLYGDLVGNDVPVLNGTAIHGVVADPSPYLPQSANMRHDAAVAIETNFVNLVPVTMAELEFLNEGDREERIEQLDEAFAVTGVETLDLRRQSAI